MITSILETEKVVKSIQKWLLIDHYKKAKSNILRGHFSGNQLRMRQPKSSSVYYFRINKQYRALAKRSGNTLTVFSIDNHS